MNGNWEEWCLLIRGNRQDVPTLFGEGNGCCSFCHLIYPFKKSTITSETDLPSDRAFAIALAHS
jgi:hypothetical protein